MLPEHSTDRDHFPGQDSPDKPEDIAMVEALIRREEAKYQTYLRIKRVEKAERGK